MTRTMHALSSVLFTLAVLAAPAAARRSHIGGHVGYDFDRGDAVVGGQLSLPFNRFLELYPSVDVYLVGTGSLLGFNGDLKYRLTPGAPLQFYVGGGLSVLRTSAGGASATDTGWDLFGGFESRRSYIHPYVEARVLMHDRSTLQVNAGLNFTLF